jgi:hypothetical protein
MTYAQENAKYEAKQAQRASAAKKLQLENPHLVPVQAGVSARITATKNIRIELKKAFPKFKFSVTSETFSGGDAIRVSWTDGPTVKQVEAITGKYSAGHFNGYEDLYEYDSNAFTDAFGDAKYVTESRYYSDAFTQAVLDELKAKYGTIDGIEPPSFEDFKNGRCYFHEWSRVIHLALCDKKE